VRQLEIEVLKRKDGCIILNMGKMRG